MVSPGDARQPCRADAPGSSPIVATHGDERQLRGSPDRSLLIGVQRARARCSPDAEAVRAGSPRRSRCRSSSCPRSAGRARSSTASGPAAGWQPPSSCGRPCPRRTPWHRRSPRSSPCASLLGVAEAPSFPAAAQSVRRALPPGDRSARLRPPLHRQLLRRRRRRAARHLRSTSTSAGARRSSSLRPDGDGVGARLARSSTRASAAHATLARAPRTPSPRPRAPAPSSPPAALFLDPAVLRAIAARPRVGAGAHVPLRVDAAVPRARTRDPEGRALARYVWLPPVMTDAGDGRVRRRWRAGFDRSSTSRADRT